VVHIKVAFTSFWVDWVLIVARVVGQCPWRQDRLASSLSSIMWEVVLVDWVLYSPWPTRLGRCCQNACAGRIDWVQVLDLALGGGKEGPTCDDALVN
jgi:hypothetical protein